MAWVRLNCLEGEIMNIVVKQLFPGSIHVYAPGYGDQQWVLAKNKNRKHQTCKACGKECPSLTEIMYRPLGNTMNRMDRICEKCGDELTCYYCGSTNTKEKL